MIMHNTFTVHFVHLMIKMCCRVQDVQFLAKINKGIRCFLEELASLTSQQHHVSRWMEQKVHVHHHLDTEGEKGWKSGCMDALSLSSVCSSLSVGFDDQSLNWPCTTAEDWPGRK